MVLKHSFEVFRFSFFTAVMPGPQVIQYIIVYQRYLDCYDAGEKIINPHNFGQKPQEKHVDHKSPGSDQSEFYETLNLLFLDKGVNFVVQLFYPMKKELLSNWNKSRSNHRLPVG